MAGEAVGNKQSIDFIFFPVNRWRRDQLAMWGDGIMKPLVTAEPVGKRDPFCPGFTEACQENVLKEWSHSNEICWLLKPVSDCANRMPGIASIVAQDSVGNALKISQGGILVPRAFAAQFAYRTRGSKDQQLQGEDPSASNRFRRYGVPK